MSNDKDGKDRGFYDGNGFDNLTGPGAQQAYDFWDRLEEMRKDEPLKGNLYDPRVSADFPQNPCNLPINLMLWPERMMDFVMLRGEPGGEFPPHTHGYGDEIYLIINGEGIVIIDGVEYEAKKHDIFWIPAGTPHTYRTPADKTESFDIFAVNVPGVKHTMRSTYWAGPPKGKKAGDNA
ncbi:cupin domain-containing protein [Sulfitobacter mediterraneus]|uniref:cupin domain-containing protein n=1 Tax=Sulfitobacter mediterraneus TaxID=83219 RepID=UPI001932DBA1|nr:cupin domain-containing protein [Sulfitobacter mediterraneus]MBM1634516.1 cupin domain-containing protein [Sulfitobacter mediterraneus]MBM1642333.1 cupin domain-containing protein [Sulfitobacter mediterraneus]MBM1646382.1 cupin domain-containing protein [Sulfitobacter mediterraneus]MBM1650428.1 cupin domain-containing protein [Sulfitobacter mediterraneus]MBM1654450.1 cupin domain-containing protein [Sulfitobacter mediterraneus]